ncbi:unnamed protein product, partial [Polarella glacialis]
DVSVIIALRLGCSHRRLPGGRSLAGGWERPEHLGCLRPHTREDREWRHRYHRYEEDVLLMKELGVTAYRFSISWCRIVPDGKGKVNPEGIAYYNRLIDCCLANGITPYVTLYHWDLPLTLQLENDGWLSMETAHAFNRYASACFQAYGDRVKHWMTFNESWCSAVLGYGVGMFAPGRVSLDEPYQAGHHLCLAHGMAVKSFREQGWPAKGC